MVIKEYKNEYGATIKINDAAYRNKTEAELQAIRDNANAVAMQILRNQAERELLRKVKK